MDQMKERLENIIIGIIERGPIAGMHLVIHDGLQEFFHALDDPALMIMETIEELVKNGRIIEIEYVNPKEVGASNTIKSIFLPRSVENIRVRGSHDSWPGMNVDFHIHLHEGTNEEQARRIQQIESKLREFPFVGPVTFLEGTTC